MWDQLLTKLNHMPNPVLTGVDGQGYPFSLRCSVTPDAARQVLHIKGDLEDAPLEPGPAALMNHSHNDALWDLKGFMVRGELRREAAGWVFVPQKIVPGLSDRNQLRFLRETSRTAKRYLQKRGLSRPQVDWDEIKALRKEAEARAKKS